MSAVPIEGTFTYQYMHTASYFKVPLDVNPVHLAEAIGVPPGQVIFRDFYKSPYGNLIRTAACGPSADLRESAKRDLENLVDGITASR